VTPVPQAPAAMASLAITSGGGGRGPAPLLAATGGRGRQSSMYITTDGADDPAQFQQIKNIKQWTLEGVEMFNFKPKKVRRKFCSF